MPDVLVPPLSPEPSRGEIDLDVRRRYVRLEAEDCRLLEDLREPLARNADALVEAFYDHLLRFAPVRAFLADADTIERLRVIQRGYLMSLAAGPAGEAYLANRQRVGQTHERIGLHPKWFLGAYGVYLDHLAPIVMAHFAPDADRACRAMVALTKMMILDAQIVLDEYFHTRQQKAVEHSEQLAAVGELAASIAHEVRNPLAGMKGAMEVLLRSLAVSAREREVMDEVVAQIVRLENLVRDLLTFARPQVLDRQPVQVHALLERALRLLQDEADLRRIEMFREFSPKAGTVFGDAQQLEQVFLNLIHNAVQAMEDGGTLTLTTRAEPGRVTITFKDSGRGIPASVLPNIFQPFFTTKHRGSGLGLSIVRKILDAHGAEIRVDSEAGRGTTATVAIPCNEAET
jgi:signal transduction histidine kinase